jgi:hypothetical protein
MSVICQDEFFGKTKIIFTLFTFKEKITADLKNNDYDFNETKKYFLTYFAKDLGSTRYFYDILETGDGYVIEMDEKEMNSKLKQIGIIEYVDMTTLKRKKFNISDFFKTYEYTYSLANDPLNNNIVFKCNKTGKSFINISKGFLHKDIKSYDSYDEKIKANVDRILNHILHGWNSGNKEHYDYTINWLSHALTGHRMRSALFLKSGEGAGKSAITDFLIKKVIGRTVGLSTCKCDQVVKFNCQLQTKVFLVLEELPAHSNSQWHQINDIIKDLITNDFIDVEQKHKDIFNAVNLISLIILTNNENTLKLGNEIRRLMINDVSHDFVSNTKYFNDLHEAMTDETGEAFFMYLLEHYNKNKDFNCSVVPLTKGKINEKNKNLGSLLTFFKDNFLKMKKDVRDDKTKHGKFLIKSLLAEMELCGFKLKSVNALSAELKKYPSVFKVKPYGHENLLHLDVVKFDDLLAFYKNKGFWDDDFDAFENGNEPNQKPYVDFEEENKKLREIILQLQKPKINLEITNNISVVNIAEQEKKQEIKVEKPKVIKTKTPKTIVVEKPKQEKVIRETKPKRGQAILNLVN